MSAQVVNALVKELDVIPAGLVAFVRFDIVAVTTFGLNLQAKEGHSLLSRS